MTGKHEKYHKSIFAVHGNRGILIILLLMILLVATGFVWSYKTVGIRVDGQVMEIHTTAGTPQAVLKAAGVNLNPLDEYSLSTDKLKDGTIIDVYRAVPVKFICNKVETDIVTAKQTVGEAAQAAGFGGEHIRFMPSPDTTVTAGMTIRVMTLHEEIAEEVQPIFYGTIRQGDGGLEKGVERRVQSGADGLKKVVLKRSFADEELIGTEVVGEAVLKEAQPELIAVGTRDVVETSRGMMRFRSVMWMEATAYNPTDGSTDGITATGIAARHGIVAVDPDTIPLGTRVYIPGYGLALAADTGGDIIGNRIDLCMEGYSEAWGFGRRAVKVYILE